MLPKGLENQISEIINLFIEYKYMKKSKIELQNLETNIIKIINSLDTYDNNAIVDLIFTYNEHMKHKVGILSSKYVMDTSDFYEKCGDMRIILKKFLNKLRERINTLEIGLTEFPDNKKIEFYHQIEEYIINNKNESLEDLLNKNIIDINYVPNTNQDLEEGVWVFTLPLIVIACEYHNFNAIKMFCNNNVNLNIRVVDDIDSDTSPLLTVINMNKENRYDEIIRYLLDNGSSPNFVSSLGETPLNKVVNDCDLYKEMIIKYKADVNLENALHVACEVAKPENIINLLKNNVNINTFDENGNSALHYLLNKFDNENTEEIKEIISMFINRGFNINSQNNSGNTILHQVVDNAPNANIIKYLLDNGADMNIINNNGNTAVHYLMSQSVFNILTHLLNKGIIGRVGNDDGGVALSEIVEQIKLVIDVFLEYNFDINSQNGIGNTPLYVAIKVSLEINIIKHLLNRGAKLNICNNAKQTGLQLARECRNKEIYNLITNYKDQKANANT